MTDDLAQLLPPARAMMLCGAISVGLLAGAFFFEHVGGLEPCRMCIWQRWAHVAIIGLAFFGIFALKPCQHSLGLLAVALAAGVSAGLAGYHAGVEWQFWPGPSGCTASLSAAGDPALLVDQLLATPVVRCDDVPWSLFGISMAGWNALISLDIMGIALMSFIGTRKAMPRH